MIDRGDFLNREYSFSEISDPAEYAEVANQTIGWYELPDTDKSRIAKGLVEKKVREPEKAHFFAIKDSMNQVLCAAAIDIQMTGGLKQALMHSRAVRPGHEGKGLGTLMMKKLLDAAQNEFRCRMAFGNVSKQNAGALASVLKSGFIVPHLEAMHKDHYVVYKSLDPASQIDLARLNTTSEKVSWMDYKEIGNWMRRDYSIVAAQKEPSSNDLLLKMNKLSRETRRDPTWGFPPFD